MAADSWRAFGDTLAWEPWGDPAAARVRGCAAGAPCCSQNELVSRRPAGTKVILFAFAIVVVGILAGLYFYAGSGPSTPRYASGVVRANGGLFVVTCDPAGIGSLTVQQGAGTEGRRVLRVSRSSSGAPLAKVSLGVSTIGYVTEPPTASLDAAGTYSIQDLADPAGGGLNRFVLTFRPADVTEGAAVGFESDADLDALRACAR